MFKIVEKTELNQISLTGARALVLIGLLIVKPRTFKEIKDIFISLQIMEETHSDDILRIDLNTIKSMGCEISRSSAKTDFKYVLTKHPFSLNVSEKEILILKRVYNLLKIKMDLTTLIEYDDLFKKIAEYIFDEEIKEIVLGISVLKYYDSKTIKELINDCEFKNILKLNYCKPNSTESIREIIAQEIVYKNGKLYLYGYDLVKDSPIVLNLRRLKKILSRRSNNKEIKEKNTKVKFLLKNIKKDLLEQNEKIIEVLDDNCVVEGIYHNDFLATQRILSFGVSCIVLEPLVFKNGIIQKIKETRKIYEC